MAKTATSDATPIEALLREKRKFPPPKDFVKHANVNTPSIYKDAAKNPARFWERFARELHWFKPWKKTLEWKVPYAKWFVGGKLNVSYNCLDRHIDTARRTKAALIWEGEPGDTRTLTYWDLYREVNRFAAALKRRGVKKGDRVTIYMPMVPETAIAMLACTRIGAPHSVIFGGFAPDAVKERIHDAESTVLITADGGWRRGGIVPLKKNVDEALRECPEVKTVIVLKRTGQEIAMEPGRDVWWDEFVKDAPAPLPRREDGRRGHALPPLHLGFDGQAQGHRAHDGRLPHRRLRDHEVGLRPPRHRRVLVHRRYRLGDRALVRDLRPARQWRDDGDVRGHARLPRQGPLLAHRGEARRDHLLHRAHRHPHVHALGRGIPEAV